MCINYIIVYKKLKKKYYLKMYISQYHTKDTDFSTFFGRMASLFLIDRMFSAI